MKSGWAPFICVYSWLHSFSPVLRCQQPLKQQDLLCATIAYDFGLSALLCSLPSLSTLYACWMNTWSRGGVKMKSYFYLSFAANSWFVITPQEKQKYLSLEYHWSLYASLLLNEKLGPSSWDLAVGCANGSVHQSNTMSCKLVVLLHSIVHNCLPIYSVSVEAPWCLLNRG